jgi:hypothetical protein
MASALAPRSFPESTGSLNAAIAQHLIAERGGKRTGDEIRFSCVFPENHSHGDRNPSASFNEDTGLWLCHACGAKGNAYGLADRIGLPGHHATPKNGTPQLRTQLPKLIPSEPKPAVRIPELVETECSACGGTHRRPAAHYKLGKPSVSWFYHPADGGEPIAVVLRFDSTDGSGGLVKEYFQFNPVELTWKAPAEPRPLYRLDQIEARRSKPVVLVEGEKCADTLANLGLLATTTIGGANGVGKADLRPLAGRRVYLWRDNDAAGENWLDAMRERLPGVGVAELLVVPIPTGMPDKWDAADAIAEGWDAARIQELLAGAEPPPPLPKRLKVLEFDEALALDIPPREQLLDPWLPAQGLVMVYAARGAGKTHFALGSAYAIATGGEFMRFRAPKPKRVLYIDGEMPLVAMQERLRMLASGSRLRPEPGYFRLITPDYQSTGIPDLATFEGRQAVEEFLTEGVDLLVIDNLSALVRSGEENAAESWIPIQDFALNLRRRGISVLFVHHAGKGGQQRGTSKREDSLDSVVALRQPRDYKPEDGARFEVHFEKARGFHGKAAEAFEARLEFGESGEARWVLQSLEDQTTRKVAELASTGLTIRQIEQELKDLGVKPNSKSAIQRHQEKARKLGWLQ